MSADIDNMKVIVIPVTIVLLIVSIILAFYYFRLTARYEANSLAKLSFVDYIPLELQLGIVGGSGFGLGVLFLTLCEELKSFSMLAWILAGELQCAGYSCLSFAVLFQGIQIAQRSFISTCSFIGSALRFIVF